MLALQGTQQLQAHYPAALARRYRLPDGAAVAAGVSAALHADALLEAIARQRGLVQSGGRVNLQQAAEAVLNDFRAGALGRITLETPAEHAAWMAAGEAQEAARRAKKVRGARAAGVDDRCVRKDPRPRE